jgi:Skp family chaperone for outer membrane proteins
MSFGDLISSGRGPGVIGMFMAVVVLVGFGAISIFVFDAELQGEENSVAAQIRRQTDEIDLLTHQITLNNARAEDSANVIQSNKKLEELVKKNAADEVKLANLRDAASEAKDSIFAKTREYNTYVSDYRNQIRRKAVGEVVPVLKLKSGESYTDVEIREVTDIGVEIRHSGGQSRLAFEKLSSEWQERFQFDPEEKAKALAREQEAQKLYDSSIAQNPEIEEETVEDAPLPEGSLEIDKAIRAKTMELARLKTFLNRLQAEAGKAETQDVIDRPKGTSDPRIRMGLRARIQATESKMLAVSRQIAALKTKQPR